MGGKATFEDLPCATLLDFGHVQLQQVVDPGQQLLSTREVSLVYAREDNGLTNLDSPIVNKLLAFDWRPRTWRLNGPQSALHFPEIGGERSGCKCGWRNKGGVGEREHLKELAVAKAWSTKPRHQSGGAKSKACLFYVLLYETQPIVLKDIKQHLSLVGSHICYEHWHLFDVSRVFLMSTDVQGKRGYH